MKFAEMMDIAPAALKSYYDATNQLIITAVAMRSKRAGFLVRQSEMCESAARRRGMLNMLTAYDSDGRSTVGR